MAASSVPALKPRHGAWLCAGFGVALAGAVMAAPAPEPAPGPSPEATGPDFPFVRNTDGRSSSSALLVGLLVNGTDRGREVAVLDGELDGETKVAIGMLCDVLGLHAQRADEAWRISTPIGDALLARQMIVRIGEIDYAPLQATGDALGLDLKFDRGEFALRANGAWLDQTSGGGPPAALQDLPIDVPAPRANLSAWRSEVTARHSGGNTDLVTLTELGGALGSGNWQLRYFDDLQGQRRIDEWGWLIDRGRSRWFLGQQQVSLSSLLPGISLTGVQWAHTNRPELAYGDTVVGNEVIASRIASGRQIQGDGPPGGLAELRANGRVVARTIVRLDGHYRFPEISGLPSDAVLEVALYRPASPDVPVRVEQVTLRASDDLLASGTYVIHAGAGSQENPLDSADIYSGEAGFARVRRGINRRLTADATLLRVNGDDYGSAGVALNLGRAGVWSGHVGRSNSAGAAEVLGEGGWGKVFWTVSLREFQADYFGNGSAARRDHQVEAGWQQPRLRLSLIGRDFEDPVLGERRYVKPAIAAQPSEHLWLSARPDYLGNYAYAATWQPFERSRFSASRYAERRQIDWQQQLSQRFDLTTAVVDDDNYGQRQSVVLYRRPENRFGWWWGAGALHSRGRYGALVDAGVELRPGLNARFQYQDDPLYTGSSIDSRVIMFSLTADFAVTPTGLTRGAFNPEQRRVGAIAAHVDRDRLPPGVASASLKGVGVLVDGQVRGELDADGRVLINRLGPGVHRVALDMENLPIDLNPADATRNVEVRAGSTTPLEFTLSAHLGCAGYAGREAAGWRVRLVDESGNEVAVTQVSSIGYYRFDTLKAGRYELQLTDPAGSISARRALSLQNGFLYQQDLAKPTPESTP